MLVCHLNSFSANIKQKIRKVHLTQKLRFEKKRKKQTTKSKKYTTITTVKTDTEQRNRGKNPCSTSRFEEKKNRWYLKCFKSSEFSWNVTENINCKSCEVACFCLMQIGHISKNDSVS